MLCLLDFIDFIVPLLLFTWIVCFCHFRFHFVLTLINSRIHLIVVWKHRNFQIYVATYLFSVRIISFLSFRQVAFNEALNKVVTEKDRVIEDLRRRESSLISQLSCLDGQLDGASVNVPSQSEPMSQSQSMGQSVMPIRSVIALSISFLVSHSSIRHACLLNQSKLSSQW